MRMKTVRAKFTCTGNQGGQIALVPVYSGSEENEQFYAATPGGSISLSVVNEKAIPHFVPGKEYYVDFTPAE
jgi:hypothetical protein